MEVEARARKQAILKAAAEKALQSNARVQKEQEAQDADFDGHLSPNSLKAAVANAYKYNADADQYSVHSQYTSLLQIVAGAASSSSSSASSPPLFQRLWENAELPGEDQRPKHQRLAFNDAIEHWADSEDRSGLSPNEPRSSSMPPGTATIRISPLRAALRERLRGEAQERERLNMDSTATQARIMRAQTAQTAQTQTQTLSMGHGFEEGNEQVYIVYIRYICLNTHTYTDTQTHTHKCMYKMYTYNIYTMYLCK
jgi:hypothetical protein